MERIIECVPNFSEGRDKKIIDSIAEAIASAGPKVLNIDPGEAANRTVITFAGTPEDVCEGAFRGVMKAAELIDMRKHHGTHPRSGATDVLPLVPISGVTLEECAEMARALAKRIYDELGIACYCYEAAAFRQEFRNLAVCRAGEYEALPEKLADPQRRPDFGPETMTPAIEKSGAINVGARNYLIAVNFNLGTESAKLANAIAFDVREKGRIAPDGTRVPGTLKGCKALGWFIEEYGIAQVSMNITDIDATPLHRAFEEVSRAAEARGVHVTGTEIIGLVPERVLLEAGRYFLGGDASDEDLIDAAVEAMGLSDLRPFVPSEKILEYRIRQ